MESLHGVDVSWLHRSTASPSTTKPRSTPSEPIPIPQNTSSQSDSATAAPSSNHQRSPSTDLKSSDNLSPPATSSSLPSKSPPRRPGLLSRLSSEKSAQTTATTAATTSPAPAPPDQKKSSWRSSISSKFSSSQAAPKPSTAASQPQTESSVAQSAPRSIAKIKDKDVAVEDEEQNPLAQSPKPTSSFLSTALRRLSSSSATQPSTPTITQVAPCERKVLNIDHGRERATLKEIDQATLRRVAFSVDVEIAGSSRYPAEENPPPEEDQTVKKAKKKDKKLKERAEGEALKNPQFVKEAVRQADRGGGVLNALGRDGMFDIGLSDDNEPPPTSKSPPRSSGKSPPPKKLPDPKPSTESKAPAAPSPPPKPASPPPTSSPTSAPSPPPKQDGPSEAPATESKLSDDPTAKQQTRPHDRPTTDPLRIYRRCCQLREAPVLKRISEQLGNPNNCAPDNPGVVNTLNLNKSRMQLSDVVCLGDWLAVVPVKRLLLEDANLTNEGVRVILAGVLAAKPPELHRRKRGRSSPTRLRDNTIFRTPGLIEKITLKNNPKITSEGWKHICLFLHLSKSIAAVDVSMIPFPPTKTPITTDAHVPNACDDPAHLLYEALSERRGGDKLDELLFGECGLTAHQVSKITQAATKVKLKRLGLAGNHLDEQALGYIGKYLRAKVCKGLDLGGNDLRDKLPAILAALESDNPLWALCLANCNLDTASLKPLFPALAALPDVRFLDLSHNHDLFGQQPTALSSLRTYLPQLRLLKRIHLIDVDMSPADAIGLAEIIPEVKNLAHLNVLENPKITAVASTNDSASQEEACALYASMMTAVRLSKTLFCVDIDIPGRETSEVVKALARQVTAYCLRNMERLSDADALRVADAAAALPDLSDADTSIIDQITGGPLNEFGEKQSPVPAEHDQLIMGGTGWMKALNYCLDAANFKRFTSAGDQSPSPALESADGKSKAKEVSKNLLNMARNIRTRAEAAIAREESGPANLEVLRRLQFLHQALNNMIRRFEEEYPDTRLPTTISSTGEVMYNTDTEVPEGSSSEDNSRTSSPSRPSEFSDQSSAYEHPTSVLDDFFDNDPPTSPLNTSQAHRDPMGSRRGSETELHNRALTDEEGQMHKIGQRFRREVLPPAGQKDMLHGTSEKDAPEPAHLARLRRQLEEYGGEEIKGKLQRDGVEGILKELELERENTRN